MQPDFSDKPLPQSFQTQPQKSSIWLYLLGSGIVLMFLVCGGCFAFLGYVGIMGPETSVYKRGDVPDRFLDTAREIGGLEDGESIEYFYSDALVNITNGFSYVSDRKVVVYDPNDTPPLKAMPFESIRDVNIDRDESFLTDSTILVETEDGFTSFPVSSEMDRDVEFFETIRRRSPNLE